MYSCNICGRSLIEEEVDKSIIAKKSVPSKRKETDDLYNKLMGSEKEGKTKKRLWRSPARKTTALTALELSQISELSDIEGLTVPIILEFIRDSKIKNLEDYNKSREMRELLLKLAQEDPAIIPFLYSSLVQLDPNPRAFELRFAVFYSSYIPKKSKIVIPHQSTIDKDCDLKIIESSGKETWIYYLEEDIDNLENLAKKVFTVDFKSYPNIKRIFLVAKSFSYLAKGLILKYQSVLTGIDTPLDEGSTEMWRSIPLLLWQSVPGKINFQNVSLK